MHIDLDRARTKSAAMPDRFDLYHKEQQEYWNSTARFNACCGGRRSGKSVIGRKRIARAAMRAHIEVDDPAPRFVIGAPTREQVKRLHWEKIKALIPPLVRKEVRESELRVTLINNAHIQLIGFDNPQRAEGEAIHGALLDEIADLKEEAWTLSVRPSLGTRGATGWCDMIGKPRGKNHWWRIWEKAKVKPGWRSFWWNAEDVLDAEEIEQLKQDLDPLSYDQEVRANFINFSGRAYYAYIAGLHDQFRLPYAPGRALNISFDFNVSPGSASISQEQIWDNRTDFDEVWHGGDWVTPWIQGKFTALIGEVAIHQNSNTLRVIRQLIKEWAPKHDGVVNVYADATGGARKTSALSGSDLDILKRELATVKNWVVRFQVPRSNPPERDRVNAVNTRFMSANGRIRCLIDSERCPSHATDLDAVTVRPGSGELDKKDILLTHWSDSLGYLIHRIAPVRQILSDARQI